MLISIICGVYNAQKTIARLLDSLLGQSYHEIEIITVINGSEDRSGEICEEYAKSDGRVVVYRTEEKLGAGGARAKGASLAQGEYLAVVDCDDYVGRDYIKDMVQAAGKNRKPDVVLAGFRRVDKNGKTEYVRKFESPEKALCQSVAPWAKLYRKDFLERNQITFRNIPFGEDILFTMDVRMAKPKICLCGSTEYFWVNRPDSTSHTEIRGFPEKNIQISTQYIGEMLPKYKVSKAELSYYIYKYMIWYILQSGRNVGSRLMKKEYGRAIRYMDQKIPGWQKGLGRYIRHLKEERMNVKIVLRVALGLRKIYLDTFAFSVYSILPMDRFWPSL